ncbi:MAG: DNA primase [Patescibacteria group bacterium]
MKSSVDEIKSRLNIVELIKEYTQLKQVGPNWKGLCPFHSEKTPSFMVSEDKQVWHCFGCGEGGDMFTFIEKIENVDFVESLRILAKKANVELTPVNKEEVSKRNRFIQLHELAVKFYQQTLFSNTGSAAREYIKSRGLTKETVVAWRIGYAPDAWDGMLKRARSKQFTENDLVAAGLATRSDRGDRVYDRFRDRVVFPIVDHNGQTVGFTGRLLAKDKEAAKYVNSPQTDLFDKSKVLFGLYQAKQAIKKSGFAILTEGQMDVISAHQAGTENTVASSGTALTEEQLQMLLRFTKEIVVAYDQDSAGIKALERSIDLALEQGFVVKVVLLPEGDDPDTVIMRDPDEWRDLVDGRMGYIDYFFEKINRQYDLEVVTDKKQAAKDVLRVLARIPDKVEQDVYIQRLARMLQVSADALRQSLPAQERGATKTSVEQPQPAQKAKDQRHSRELRILASMLLEEQAVSLVKEILVPDDFSEEQHKKLYNTIVLFYNQAVKSDTDNTVRDWPSQLGQYIQAQDEALASILQTLTLLSEDLRTSGIDTIRDAQTLASLIKRNILQQQIHSLHQLLESQPANADEVLRHISEVTKQLKTLSQ